MLIPLAAAFAARFQRFRSLGLALLSHRLTRRLQEVKHIVNGNPAGHLQAELRVAENWLREGIDKINYWPMNWVHELQPWNFSSVK